MMWPSGRFQPWGIVAFQPHIIFRKYTSGAGTSTFYIHLNTLNKVNLHVSSQALLRIHVHHTRWSLHHFCILQIFRPHQNIKDLVSKLESTQQEKVSKNQNNMIGNCNHHQISQRASDILFFSLDHRSYTDWEMKHACCARILFNFS